MVKFKGRLSFRQYLPMKPIKWGVKLWTLCESETGYTVNFQVYTGQEQRRVEHGLGYRVVMDMVVMLHRTQAQVFFDNYFTSVPLMKNLKLLGIQACGTIRANRKDLPAAVVPGKNRRPLPRHEFIVAQRDELVFVNWQDTKPVCVLSNFHDPTDRGTVSRRHGAQRDQVDVVVPRPLADYQRYMKGVDSSDQMVQYYLIHHRSWKWWRRIYFHHLMVSVHNAYVVARFVLGEAAAKKMWPSFQIFVEDVAHQLTTTTTTRAPPARDVPRRATLDHKIERIFQTRKVCFVCKRKSGNQRPGATNFGCVKCQEPCHVHCQSEHLRYHNSVHDDEAADGGGEAVDNE